LSNHNEEQTALPDRADVSLPHRIIDANYYPSSRRRGTKRDRRPASPTQESGLGDDDVRGRDYDETFGPSRIKKWRIPARVKPAPARQRQPWNMKILSFMPYTRREDL